MAMADVLSFFLPGAKVTMLVSSSPCFAPCSASTLSLSQSQLPVSRRDLLDIACKGEEESEKGKKERKKERPTR